MESDEAALVFFAFESEDSLGESMANFELLDDLHVKIGDFVNCVYYCVGEGEEDLALFNKHLPGNLPQFRTFKNHVTGKKKQDSSY